MPAALHGCTRLLLAACCLFAAAAAAPAEFPIKPVRFLVGFAPGGGADIVVRAFAPSMADQLGKQVIVDNRPGGSGIIGMELGAKAAPDGLRS